MNKPINNSSNTAYEIVLATTNAGKINEINEIFKQYANLNIKLSSLKAYNVDEPDEPFETCLENAIHKAKYYAQITKLPTLSEDAGLYIEALDGFPGVRTKDFIVEQGNATNAFNTLQAKLAAKTNHRAFFKCAAVIYFPDSQKLLSFEADTFGTLTFPARGTTGFGFDPIFIPEGYTQTMAELGEAIKNKISHRALAMNGLLQQL